MATIYDFVIIPSLAGAVFANRHVSETLQDSSSESLTLRRRILTTFQRMVMDVFAENMLEVADIGEDLMYDDDPDVVDTYKVWREFTSLYPDVDIISLFPLDTGGTFGFVILPKPMTPVKSTGA